MRRAGGAPVALVTGASRGIGAATARLLAESGYQVVVTARSTAALEALAAACVGLTPIAADLSSAVAVEAFVAQVRTAVGDAPDVVVNNAGRFPMGPVESIGDDELTEAIALNLVSPLRLLRAFLPAMRLRGSGHLVTIGSIADRQSFPGNALYAATKFGARAVHETVREETRGTGIRTTLISPSATDTALWDAHDPDSSATLPSRSAMLAAEDVAECVRWAVTRPAHVTIDELRLSRS